MENEIRNRDRIITPEQAINSFYIDFEGEGKKSDDDCPMPHMLGVYRPKSKDKLRKRYYRAVLFKSEWQPIANGQMSRAELGSLDEKISYLVSEVSKREANLVFFSDHERKVVERHCAPDVYEAFLSVAFNVKPPLDRMYNLNHPKDTSSRPDSLEGYGHLFFPKLKISSLDKSVGQVCRDIDGYCTKTKRWRNWNPKHQDKAKTLLQYNLSDCHLTWKLASKLANSQSARKIRKK